MSSPPPRLLPTHLDEFAIADKAALLKKAKAQLAAEKQRGEDLARRFSDNEQSINQLNVDLQTAIADLGEMFGVVRQVSNDTAGLIDGQTSSSFGRC